jgi:hypothetical protein
VVVNTGDRFAARKHLLKAFKGKLDRFKQPASPAHSESIDTQAIDESEMIERGFTRPLPIELIVSFACLLVLVFYYSEHTTFRNPFRGTFVKVDVSDDGD